MKTQFKLVIISVLLLLSSISHAGMSVFNGDLQFNPGTDSMTVRMEAVSLPFEGLNDPSNIYNRLHQIQNGAVHRRYYNVPPFKERKIHLIEFGTSTTYTMHGCHLEDWTGSFDSGSKAWGFAKYKITIDVGGETFIFYWDFLDSDYGKSGYHQDWSISYYNDQPLGKRIEVGSNAFGVPYAVIYPNSSQHLKVWEMFFNEDKPRGRQFYARSTPFGASPDVIDNDIREFVLGTTVIFDGCYENTSSTLYGYNTDNVYYSNTNGLIIPLGENSPGNTYTTPGVHSTVGGFNYGCQITAESGDTMRLNQNKKLFVLGLNLDPLQGDILKFKSGSSLEIGAGSQVSSYHGGVIVDEGSKRVWNPGAFHKIYAKGVLDFAGQSKTYNVDNGAHIEIDGGAKLQIADNSILEFDGANTYLKLNSNSDVILGNNSKIIFKNGAYLDADGAEFTSSGTWEGIYFEDAGTSTQTSTIKNCTIVGAKVPLKIYNTSTSTANNNITIQNNIIDIPESYGIYADHANKLLIKGNTFTGAGIPGVAIYIRHPYLGDGLPGGGGGPSYSLNIVSNIFKNTGLGMILAGYTSSLPQYYIYDNKANDLTYKLSGYGIIGRRITGTIKDNKIKTNGMKNVLIHQSNPNFYNNEIVSLHSTGIGLVLLDGSSPKLLPYVPNEQDFVWSAGNNQITGNEFSIQLNSAFSLLMDYGQNILTKSSSTNDYHIYGYFSNTTNPLNARNNCWEPSGPNNYVWNNNGNPNNPNVTVVTTPSNFQCQAISPTGYNVTDMGNGIFDTVWTAENDAMPDSIGEDEIMYGQAQEYLSAAQYLEAISAFKTLIDENIESAFLQTSMLDMYTCYVSLDTFTSQNDREILYGSLKTYMEDLISSENYESKINEEAYNIILSCLGNMGEFDEVVTGYQFLALYHPDPETRLMSSDDLTIVEELMEGEGSGRNLSSEQYIKKIKAKIDKLISGDPLLKKMKQSFDKTKENNKKNTEKDLNRKYGKEKAALKLERMKMREEKFDNRVRENMAVMRNLSKEEKEKRQFETIMFMVSNGINDIRDDNVLNSIPGRFSLEQNYPNPFNPSTTISYSIPNDLIVKIKIYDIAGREISTLVNELKTGGNHSVSFNGNNLASGVYFYKIEAGTFIETKRMVLVK